MGPVDPVPHASWAEVYDRIYEQTFGRFYTDLTQTTLDVITEIGPPDGRILDYGAGTGRLAIPLAQAGHAVTAVEPCAEMLTVLQAKAAGAGVTVDGRHASMQAFAGDGTYDIAACVFTVIIYLLDETAVEDALDSAFAALRPGGHLLIDVPERALFQSFARQSHDVRRTVTISARGGNLFDYEESTKVRTDGRWTTYRDAFQIRHWPPAEIRHRLEAAGFLFVEDLTPAFTGAASNYWLWQKPPGI